MVLVDFDVVKHPNEFKPLKFLPFELLKLESTKKRISVEEGMDDFEQIDREEINEAEKRIVTKVVNEITSIRLRELQKNFPYKIEILDQVISISLG